MKIFNLTLRWIKAERRYDIIAEDGTTIWHFKECYDCHNKKLPDCGMVRKVFEGIKKKEDNNYRLWIERKAA